MKRIFLLLLTILAATQITQAKKEVISFDLKFGFVKGGEAKLIITEGMYNNEPAVTYHLIGRTTGLANKLYGVNDEYITVVDAKTGLPLKSIRNIEEGKYRWYNETFYFQDQDSIYSQKSGGRSVPDTLVDIVSVFFYFIDHYLMDDVEKGEKVTLPTFHADKINDVSVQYLGDRKIETDLGRIDAHVLAPVVDKGKLLKRSDGLQFFISKDKKVPVLLEFDMRVGALRAELTSYTIDGVEQIVED